MHVHFLSIFIYYLTYSIIMVFIAGIDEAGRGPVIGPMVVAGISISENKINQLINLGVKDSKLLSIDKRNYMFEKIKKIVDKYEIIIVTPKQIDYALNTPELNLNKLETITMAKIINLLKADKIIIDCPSSNEVSFVEYLKTFLDYEPEIIAEHKADLKYAVASAASILAKVTRDNEIEILKQKINMNFGSGYPSDPLTIKFLKENYNKFDFFRKSWASYKKLVNEKNQKNLNNF
jgi:ribonuclease HII